MAERYLPRFVYQLGDPTTGYDPFICTMSSGAMLLDYHTKGKIQVWGGQLLDKTGLTHSQIIDGTNLFNLDKAWDYYGQTLLIRRNGWNYVLEALNEGRSVLLQGDYDRFSPSISCQAGFTGNHAVYINKVISSTHALVGDPLCSAYKEVPLIQLREYAEKLAQIQAGDKNALFYAVSQIVDEQEESESMRLFVGQGRAIATIGSVPYYDAPEGTKLGTTTPGVYEWLVSATLTNGSRWKEWVSVVPIDVKTGKKKVPVSGAAAGWIEYAHLKDIKGFDEYNAGVDAAVKAAATAKRG